MNIEKNSIVLTILFSIKVTQNVSFLTFKFLFRCILTN